MKLVLFGLNHRTAPLELRESWSLSSDEISRALGRLGAAVQPSEHLVISTCNRTEFYSHVPKTFPLPDNSELGRTREETAAEYAEFYRSCYAELSGSRPELPGTIDASHYYVHVEEMALEHLFRLSSGLDSMILGESQILKQIKDAYTVAKESGAAGRFFHRLIPAALRTGKRVRTSTAISEGCITPGQAALSLARNTLGNLENQSLLVIGSGKIAESTAQAFRESPLRQFVVVNRTAAHAQELIARIGRGTLAPWSSLEESIQNADVVVSSTGAVDPIVPTTVMARIQATRQQRPMVIVDLAIPRDFEPEVGQLGGVSLFNIDDLNQVIQQNVAERCRHVPLAERIVREEILVFQRWATYLQVDPVLRHMIERFEQIRLGELQSYISQFPPEYHELLKEMTSSLMKKLLHFPIEKLKSLRDLRGLDEKEVSFLKRLFLADI